MSTTLPLYYTLASTSTNERLDASVSLLTTLEKFQAQHAAPSTVEEDAKKQFEALHAPDVQYAVNRLVKGLASSREQSRLGFSVALTELLQRIPTISCSHVLSLVLSTTQMTAGLSAAEQRDLLFARLFGLTALIESGVLFRSEPPAVGSSNLKLLPTASDFATIISELIKLGEKKSWLRESAWWALVRALDALHASDVAWKDEAVSQLCSEVFEARQEWTLEKLALALRLQQLRPDLDWPRLVAPTFKQGNLLAPANLPIVARLFKSGTADDGEGKTSGTWRPQLHFAWDIVLNSYLDPNATKASSPSSEFQDFFRMVVDESLFSYNATDVRKAWGFQVFAKALPRAPAAQLPLIFTPNFMRTWINHLSKSERYLHEAALALVDVIRKVAEENPSVAYTLVAQLTGKHGHQRFDMITKTKTVRSLVESMDIAGMEEYVKFLLQAACSGSEGDDTTGVEAKRLWIIDQMQPLIKMASIPKSEAWVGMALEFLTVHGFFIMKSPNPKSKISALHTMPHPLFSPSVQARCRERLNASLVILNDQRTAKKGKSQQNGADSGQIQDVDWFARTTALLQKLAKRKTHAMPVLEADQDIIELRTATSHALDRLAAVEGEQANVASACALLLRYLLIQTYADDIDVSEILPDAIQATSKLLGISLPTEETSDDINAPTIDLLLDVLVALLEGDSAYARELVIQVFSGLTKEVLPSTLQFLIAQLENKPAGDEEEEEEDIEMAHEEEAGQTNPGAKASDAEDSEEDDDDDSEEEDDEDDDGEKEEEEEEENEEQAAATAALRARLSKVLKANGLAADSDEGEDEEDESDEEDIVDDETMLRLDDQLADALKSQIGDKKGQKNAQREATIFKIRVLDLVDTYMKMEPTNELLLQFIVPLLDLALFSSSDEVQLGEKASGIIRARLSSTKDFPTLGERQAGEVMNAVYDRMRRAGSKPVALQTLNFLTKALSRRGKDLNGTLVDFYRSAIQQFVTRKSAGIPLTLFNNLIASAPACGWALRDTLLALIIAKDAPNRINQRKLLGLLTQLLSQINNIEIPSTQLREFYVAVRETLYEALKQALDAPSFHGDHVRELLKSLHRAVRSSAKTVGNDKIDAVWETSTFEGIAARLAKEHANIPSLRDLANQVLQSLPSGARTQIPNDDGKKKKKAMAKADEPQSITNVVTDDVPSTASPPKPKLKRPAEPNGDAALPKPKKKKTKTSS